MSSIKIRLCQLFVNNSKFETFGVVKPSNGVAIFNHEGTNIQYVIDEFGNRYKEKDCLEVRCSNKIIELECELPK